MSDPTLKGAVMKKFTCNLLFFASFMFASKLIAGEVTDKEWNVLDHLVVTYYSGSSGFVDCTAFNSANKPIGGGSSPAQGGVARVSIDVPKKYVGNDLRVSCK